MQGQQPASNPNRKRPPGLTHSHFAYKFNTATTKTTATHKQNMQPNAQFELQIF